MDDHHKKGGVSRMNQLTPEEKTALSKKAYQERMNPSIPKATHCGILTIGNQQIECAVLSDGRRVLSETSIWKLTGRSRPGPKTRKNAGADRLPAFLGAKNINPFVMNHLPNGTQAIVYKAKGSPKCRGYECSILPIYCEAYLEARDAGVLTRDQQDIAKSADTLIRSLAKVGIVALVDEATGFQEVRDRFALQAILDKYLRKEYAEWAKRFPPSFYQQIFRLNNWKFAEISAKKPMIIGRFTNDIVYSRLMPELVEELQNRNPKNDTGYRESKHHQWLSDIGHVDLDRHISAVTSLMKCCKDWSEFKNLLEKVFPIKSSKEIVLQ